MGTATTLSPYEIILRKREGQVLSADEIDYMVLGFLRGEVADYQMSAFLMATFFAGMTGDETVALTRVMLGSGDRLDMSRVEGPKVDKHSTGGVGDKLSLVVAPVAAAAGVRVPMISGRGLGHTGGTLDKLESIPGMRTDFGAEDFVGLVSDVGMAIVGQSASIAPADKKMYALRDVTATIECVPLIVGSILSKKLAADLDALVLDVKVGAGAFMGDLGSARALATHLVGTSRKLGLPAAAVMTDMENPLGRTVGNALEVAESVEVLKGGGAKDVREVSLALASRMIAVAGIASGAGQADAVAAGVLDDGRALRVFERFVEAQGGDPRITEEPGLLPSAPVVAQVTSASRGFVSRVDALAVGLASTGLGAGRTTVGESVDHSVGVEILAPAGTEVCPGDTLALVHAGSEPSATAAVERVADAFQLSHEKPPVRGKVLEVME